jgi:hypothetical protein
MKSVWSVVSVFEWVLSGLLNWSSTTIIHQKGRVMKSVWSVVSVFEWVLSGLLN